MSSQGVGMFGHDDSQKQEPEDTNPQTTPADPAPGTNPFADFGNPTPAPSVNDVPPASGPADDSSVTPTNDDLLHIKQEALQQLTPLVNHLEQSPEEKFRTVMMMIQASDDHTKLKEAFDAAKQITDDKVRAQALLDVINEINYFTQQHHS